MTKTMTDFAVIRPTEWKVSDLKPHPMNTELFDDIEGQKWEEFLTSVQRQGVLVPLVITEDGTIISGHQRYRACLALNITEVPCRVLPITDPDTILLALIDCNIRQRGVINSPTVKLGRMMMELERLLGAGDRDNGGAVRSGVPSRAAIRKYVGVDNNVAKCAKALAKMPEPVQELVENDVVSARTAYDIISKLPEDQQIEFAMSLDPMKHHMQAEVKAALEHFFPKAKEIDEMQQKLAEYQQGDGELELREKLNAKTAEARENYEAWQSEKRARKKERQEYERTMDATERLLQESGGDNAAEIARLTEERDQYMRDADAAQADADLQLVIGLITGVSTGLSEVANDPRPLSGDLVDNALKLISALEDKLERIKERIAAD